MATKVFVYDDNGTLRATPDPVVLKEGKKLTLIDVTDSDVEWTFPKGPFGASGTKKQTSKKGGQAQTPRAAGHADPKAYRYNISAVQLSQPATGKSRPSKLLLSSDPVIIIDT